MRIERERYVVVGVVVGRQALQLVKQKAVLGTVWIQSVIILYLVKASTKQGGVFDFKENSGCCSR